VTDLQFTDHNAPYDTSAYCVRAIYNYCESQDVCVDVSLYVGLSENDMDGVKVFPNPASDVVNIQFPGNVSRLSVINSLGLTVYSGDVTGKNLIKLNATGFMSGSYLLRLVTTEGNSFTKKIVIMK